MKTDRQPLAWLPDGIRPPPFPENARKGTAGRTGRGAGPCRAGWTSPARPGTAPEEKAIAEIRLAAAKEMERLRAESTLSQSELARRMGTKQPNVSRLFKNPGKATLDTLLQALEALGSGVPRQIAALF